MNLFFRYAAWMILLANSAWAQSFLPAEYTYDANGNLVSDANKDIAGIHYNPLNLPDTITYADGRKIIYLYTATGQKLRQQVLRADGTVETKRDYAGMLLYENSRLQQVQHDEGRVVMTGPQPEYQYHLKDHLGNVRMTVTSLNDTITYLATMETETAEEEELYFSDMAVRSTYPLANHTVGGNEVVSLSPGSENRVSLDLAVSSGDIVYLETYAYYENGVASDPGPGGGEESLRQGTAAIVSAALSAVLSGGLVSAEGITQAVSGNATGALVITPVIDETLPAAYLNYELFDKNYAMVDGGFKKVTSQGAYNQELLALGPIHVTQPGYLRVYLNNRSAKLTVRFDDLKVTHIRGPVVQEDSYDPFGMAIAGQHTERYGAVANRHLYNGKELQNDHDLNWHDYGARLYDAALGRWNAIDPMSEKYAAWSPYQYVMNNPLKFIDPDGKEVKLHTVNQETARADALRAGIQRLRSTDEGDRMFTEAENNPNITVYVVGTGAIAAYGPKAGSTAHIYNKRTRATDKGPTSLYLHGPGTADHLIFNGIDISGDMQQNRDVYLMVLDVDNFDAHGVASAAGHEFEAHVNINQKIKRRLNKDETVDVEIEGKPKKVHHGVVEHAFFGSQYIDEQGNIHNPQRGTSAERLAAQLTVIKYVHAIRKKIAEYLPR